MSNAIPKAVRPAARISPQWNAVTLAFARRYCGQQSCLTTACQSPVFIALPSRCPPRTSRCFATTSYRAAKVHLPAEPASPPQALPTRTRTVTIGPLPSGPVDEGTIRRIFGPRVSLIDGNNVLRILHHRRTSGSLADYGVDNLGKQYTHINRNLATKGLEWLREKYPVDEARAAEEWAEKEANRISYELWLANPENESKYKDPAKVFREQQKKEQEEMEAREQAEGQRIGMLHTGPSQFERNIQEKRKRRLEEIAKQAEEKEAREKEQEAKLATGEWVRTPSGTQLMKPGQTTYVDIFGREQVSRRKEKMEEYQKKAELKFESKEEMLSSTTLTQRLYPMTAVVLVVCLLSWGFAHYYVPPSPEYRIMTDLTPTVATIATLVAANCLITIAWRAMPLWPYLTRFFMHVPAHPYAVTSITNVFSHVQYEHLLSNMFYLALVGPHCHDLVDRGVFLGTYFSAGAVGTLFSLYWSNLGRGDIMSHSVGASAAIWGIATLYCLLTDQDKLKIPFLKDKEMSFYPLWVWTAFVVMEILHARRKGKSKMDHASHFGGMAVGMSVAGYLRATGFHQRRDGATVQGEAKVDEKTVDVEAVVKEEMKEIKEGVSKVLR